MTMTKKKALISAVALMLAILSGCADGSAEVTTIAPKNSAVTTTAAPTETEQTTEAAPIVYTPSEEILAAEMYSGKVQVKDKIFTFPISVAELLNEGAVITEKNVTEDYLIDADDTKYGIDIKINGKSAMIDVKNKSKTMAAVKDCDVVRVDFGYCTDVFFPKGITSGTTLSELTEKWGEFDEDASKNGSDYLSYRYYELPVKTRSLSSSGPSMYDFTSITDNSYQTLIDRATGTVKEIDFTFSDRSDTPVEITFLNKVTCVVPTYMDKDIRQFAMEVNGKTLAVKAWNSLYCSDDSLEERVKWLSKYYDDVEIVYETEDEAAVIYIVYDSYNFDYFRDGKDYSTELIVIPCDENEEVTDEDFDKVIEFMVEIAKTLKYPE